MKTRRAFALALVVVALTIVVVSCGGRGQDSEPTRIPTDPDDSASTGTTTSDRTPAKPDDTDASDSKTPTPTPTPTAGPTETPTPGPPRFAGYDLNLSEGDFWRFRWEYTDRTCSQRSGCKTKEDDGIFQVSLGEPKDWKGVTVYRVVTVGETGYYDDPTTRTFVPEWDYLGVDGNRLVATNASGSSPLVTLFDARTGKWAGSGFFTDRFSNDELVEASAGQLSGSHEFASWDGVQTGPWHFVRAAAGQGKCEIIEGLKICPREESFDYTETEYYRPGIGPFAYMFNYSASFSGGGFTSSFQTSERVALVASSFMGDESGDFGKPTPTPAPAPTATPVVLDDPIFGPVNGGLSLDPSSVDIPEFGAGVNIDRGVADVTFENPDVPGNGWSHGIMFRNSADETFHAVFITGNGEWGHFARGGSLASQVVLATGQFDVDATAGGQNSLTVWFGVLDGKSEGVFLINNQRVANLDLSFVGAFGAGDVLVVSGLFPSDEFTGAVTHFTDFTVYEKP